MCLVCDATHYPKAYALRKVNTFVLYINVLHFSSVSQKNIRKMEDFLYE